MERKRQNRQLNAWLLFDAKTEAQHETERGRSRGKDLSRGILLGLFFYNLYNLTSALLMPDILSISVALRLGVITPTSLILAYLVLVVRPFFREQLVLAGSIGAFAVPVGLFWVSNAPWAAFTFGELSLTLVFANMLLALRFRHAAVFTVFACSLAVAAAMTKPDLAAGLGLAFALQIVTAGTFTLLANYLSERRRCTDFIVTKVAKDRANRATQKTQALDLLSRTDALTGLPNRRALDDAIDSAFGAQGAMALLIIDVDHFKLYNDTLGHQAGDECLKALSAEFAAIGEKKGALAARYGGEEFVFLLTDTSEFEAARLCQIVLRRVQELEIKHPGRTDGMPFVTVSVGLAMHMQGSEDTIAEVFGNADVALYEAKRQGRNQFSLAASA